MSVCPIITKETLETLEEVTFFKLCHDETLHISGSTLFCRATTSKCLETYDLESVIDYRKPVRTFYPKSMIPKFSRGEYFETRYEGLVAHSLTSDRIISTEGKLGRVYGVGEGKVLTIIIHMPDGILFKCTGEEVTNVVLNRSISINISRIIDIEGEDYVLTVDQSDDYSSIQLINLKNPKEIKEVGKTLSYGNELYTIPSHILDEGPYVPYVSDSKQTIIVDVREQKGFEAIPRFKLDFDCKVLAVNDFEIYFSVLKGRKTKVYRIPIPSKAKSNRSMIDN